jgi:hypothetical protein
MWLGTPSVVNVTFFFASGVCSYLPDESRATLLSQFHLGFYDSRDLDHETFSLPRPCCILGFVSVVWYLFYHFNLIDFTTFTLGAMYSTFQHVVYVNLIIILMPCYMLHNMLFMWHYTPFLCGFISSFSFMWHFLPVTRNSFNDGGSCDHMHHFRVLCRTGSVLPCICTLTVIQVPLIESSWRE